MTSTDLYLPRGTTASAAYALDIGPKRAGWTYSGLRIVELSPGRSHTFITGDSEWIVLPLEGGCTVRIEESEFQLLGRDSVFAGASDFAYAPRDARVQIASGAGGRFALAGAKCERRLPARYGPAPEVPGRSRCPRRKRRAANGRVPPTRDFRAAPAARRARRHFHMCLRGDGNRRHSVGGARRATLLGWTYAPGRDPTVGGRSATAVRTAGLDPTPPSAKE